MAVTVEIGANVSHDGWLYAKDIVILKFPDNRDNETEIYIQYNTEDDLYQISCFTAGDADHTVFEY